MVKLIYRWTQGLGGRGGKVLCSPRYSVDDGIHSVRDVAIVHIRGALMIRKILCAAFAVGLLLAGAGTATAQPYPCRPCAII